ncbi:Membrane-associated zinc metalloprotease, partial [Salmonella enterica subsp. enterica serovar Uganda str. R8-3404]
TDRYGTEYVIALIPLGGYVKMLDERAEPVAPELRRHAFNNKTVGQRAAIIAAGPVANFIFAIFAYWLVFIIGVPGVRPVIGEITPNSIAAQAQIELRLVRNLKPQIAPGTELKAVDGIETPDWDAVRLQLVSKIGDQQTTVSVAPFGSDQRQDKTLDLRHWAFEPDKQDPVSSLGIRPRGPQIEPVLSEVQANSAASKAGLQAGDRIVKVDGQPLTQWMKFVTFVRDNPGKPLALEIERQGSALSLTLTPDTKSVNGKAEGFAGVVPKIIPLPEEYKTIRQYGPFSAILEATDKTWQLMKLTVSMLGKLITGDVKLNNLSGPISIAQGAGMSAEFGVIYYLMFLALISVNLGIINLFPLPVLDGGHLLFLAIEKLKGGPVSERVQDFSYRIGSILLVLLMGLALFNDFSRL